MASICFVIHFMSSFKVSNELTSESYKEDDLLLMHHRNLSEDLLGQG